MDLHNREPEPMETKDYENNMDEAEGQRQRNALQNIAMDLHNREPEPMETNGYENNMDEAKGQRKHKKSKDKDFWKQTIMASGKTFLKVFQRLLNETQADKEKKFKYMQKVYHAIFFYGHINDPQVAPKEFIPERAWDNLQKAFPKPFAEYNTHLPSQTPYSILLEYITNYYGGDKALILNELEKRNKEFFNHFYDDENNKFKLSEFALSAAVISHSCADDANAFGSLIAYKGSVPTRIMIAISCLLVWDKVISYEVRCEKGGHGIQFPKKVCCSAYKFEMNNHKYKETPPCVHCNKMFIVTFNPKCTETEEKADWPYGNCAETESLSNLLCDNEKIRNMVHTYDDDNRRTIVDRATIISRFTKLECKLKKDVKQLLESRKFRVTQNNFVLFTPAALAHR